MDQARKETVLKEIVYWKRTKLLPEQYCDYLITLYSEGDVTSQKQHEGRNSIFSLTGIGYLFTCLGLIAVHVMKIPFPLGLFSIMFFIFSQLGILYFSYRRKALFSVYLSLTNISLFLSVILFLDQIYKSSLITLLIIIFFLISLYIQGSFFKIKSIKIASVISGVIGFAVLIYNII